MLSKTSEYALRIMVLLARQKNSTFLTGEAIAKGAKVPKAYLVKILQLLNREGLVRAQKGIGGGYGLNRAIDKISLFAIIAAVDPLFGKVTKCPLGIAEHKALCPLHKKLDSAYSAFQRIFEECSLNDLV